MTWTPDRVELLKSMWTSGHSAGQIARALKGVSRGAVTGKLDRLGLKRGGGRPARQLIPPKFKRERNFHLRSVSFTALVPLNVGVMDLKDGMCRWPTSETRPHKFCGHTTAEGKPYCAEHMKQAHGDRPARKIRPPFETRIVEIAA
jgi:GcrA cell cycle regulator